MPWAAIDTRDRHVVPLRAQPRHLEEEKRQQAFGNHLAEVRAGAKIPSCRLSCPVCDAERAGAHRRLWRWSRMRRLVARMGSGVGGGSSCCRRCGQCSWG
jgi:hypothetical protein